MRWELANPGMQVLPWFTNGNIDAAYHLWNVFITNTLKQTSTNYYVIGTCP